MFFTSNFVVGYFIKNTSPEIATVKLLGGIGVLCGIVAAGVLLA
jgi:hypothetical protein